ncbi:MAG: transcriptional regulator [Gemmatimonadetes bacterium]|jgi:HTH-type transcriptional regulator/antitoxin HigA|nr:transcriptional regulator [Gemmatimonadota bacterium]MBA4159462.1 transcriptional regulator [Gemmatimonadota bacterium]
MDVKVIKNRHDYTTALEQIEALIDLDPQLGTREADRLELLTLLVQDYETKEFPATLPDPVEAIQFRMEQQGLTQRDLVPYLGGRSKVSEVLAGKRPLTLSMIRALHNGLGIPAKVLLQERDPTLLDDTEVEWERFPIREMISRGWIQANAKNVREEAEDLLRGFFAPLGPPSAVAALYRKTGHIRSARQMDEYALHAWTARVLLRAREEAPSGEYEPGSVTFDFMQELARLSTSGRGPLAARHFLEEHGIALIVEPHLPRTHLDGAAMIGPEGKPVIGLTLRHDRLDNFWFCLMHELVHVARHLDPSTPQFYDDLEVGNQGDPREAEADELAGEALIPQAVWRQSPAAVLRSPDAAQDLADQLGIHPAIVAGHKQHAEGNYKILHHLVGRGEVRACFPEINWG